MEQIRSNTPVLVICNGNLYKRPRPSRLGSKSGVYECRGRGCSATLNVSDDHIVIQTGHGENHTNPPTGFVIFFHTSGKYSTLEFSEDKHFVDDEGFIYHRKKNDWECCHSDCHFRYGAKGKHGNHEKVIVWKNQMNRDGKLIGGSFQHSREEAHSRSLNDGKIIVVAAEDQIQMRRQSSALPIAQKPKSKSVKRLCQNDNDQKKKSTSTMSRIKITDEKTPVTPPVPEGPDGLEQQAPNLGPAALHEVAPPPTDGGIGDVTPPVPEGPDGLEQQAPNLGPAAHPPEVAPPPTDGGIRDVTPPVPEGPDGLEQQAPNLGPAALPEVAPPPTDGGIRDVTPPVPEGPDGLEQQAPNLGPAALPEVAPPPTDGGIGDVTPPVPEGPDGLEQQAPNLGPAAHPPEVAPPPTDGGIRDVTPLVPEGPDGLEQQAPNLGPAAPPEVAPPPTDGGIGDVTPPVPEGPDGLEQQAPNLGPAALPEVAPPPTDGGIGDVTPPVPEGPDGLEQQAPNLGPAAHPPEVAPPPTDGGIGDVTPPVPDGPDGGPEGPPQILLPPPDGEPQDDQPQVLPIGMADQHASKLANNVQQLVVLNPGGGLLVTPKMKCKDGMLKKQRLSPLNATPQNDFDEHPLFPVKFPKGLQSTYEEHRLYRCTEDDNDKYAELNHLQEYFQWKSPVMRRFIIREHLNKFFPVFRIQKRRRKMCNANCGRLAKFNRECYHLALCEPCMDKYPKCHVCLKIAADKTETEAEIALAIQEGFDLYECEDGIWIVNLHFLVDKKEDVNSVLKLDFTGFGFGRLVELMVLNGVHPDIRILNVASAQRLLYWSLMERMPLSCEKCGLRDFIHCANCRNDICRECTKKAGNECPECKKDTLLQGYLAIKHSGLVG